MNKLFFLPVLLSIFVSYYFYKNNTNDSSVEYYLDLAFKEAPICIAFYKNISSTDSNADLSLMYTNVGSSASFSKAEDCLDIILMNSKGLSAFYSMSEPAIIDAHIDGDIEIVFSKDVDLFEKQILTLHQMVFDGLFTFGWVIQKALHLYNHYIAQNINSYGISYDWNDLHYTVYDDIIADIVDEKYKLYSAGYGYGRTSPVNKGNRYVNISRLAVDLSLEESAEIKMQYILNELKLGPGSKVLDVGGGWGPIPKFLVPLGIHVHSITIARSSFEYLKSLGKQLKKECECEDDRNDRNKKSQEDKCVCGSSTVNLMNMWLLKDSELGKSIAGTFDAMICIGSIAHMPYYKRLLANAEYFLKPGGYLLIDGFGSKVGFSSNYFLQKYMFPGDSAPWHMSTFLKAWEESNLLMGGLFYDLDNGANSWYQWAQRFEIIMRDENHPLRKKLAPRYEKVFRLYIWGFVMSYIHPTAPVQSWRVILQKPLF